MKINFLIGFVVASTLIVQPASAWNAHGHRVIASIAFLRLNPDRRLEIANRIRKHPRWEQDFAAKMSDGFKRGDEQIQTEWILQQSSAWPDTTRSLSGGERKKYDHATWHYINRIVCLTDGYKEAIGPIDLSQSTEPPAEQSDDMNAIQAAIGSLLDRAGYWMISV